MIPVTQTKVVVKDINGNYAQNGNCWAAAIASILEVPITEVPNFEVWFPWSDGFWYELTERFLIKKGYILEYRPEFRCFHPDCVKEDLDADFINFDIEGMQERLKDKYYFVSGDSPRGQGVKHVTIWQNGKMVHDPHPTRDGILTHQNFDHIRLLTEDEQILANDYKNYKKIGFPSIHKQTP